jgi:hypothetical protein
MLFACGDNNFEGLIDSDLVSSSSSKKSSSSSKVAPSSSSLTVSKCGNHDYDPATHICKDGELQEISGGGAIPSSSSISPSSKSSSSKNTSSSSKIVLSSSSSVVIVVVSSSSFSIVPSSSSFLVQISSSSYAHYGTSKSVKNFTFEDIKYWVGEGNNKAMLVIQWNDKKSPAALVWGYRWNGTKYGYDMIDDIAKADERFFHLRFGAGYLGYAIAGIGFDISGDAKISNGGSCQSPVDGSVDADKYDFDYWKLCAGTSARWSAGWYEAYWSYWVSDNIKGKWEYSGLGASSRVLTNNSVDAWYFDLDMNDPEISTFYRCMEEPDNCDGRNFFGAITPVNAPR